MLSAHQSGHRWATRPADYRSGAASAATRRDAMRYRTKVGRLSVAPAPKGACAQGLGWRASGSACLAGAVTGKRQREPLPAGSTRRPCGAAGRKSLAANGAAVEAVCAVPVAALVSTWARLGVAAGGEHGRRGGRRSRGAQAKPASGAGMVDGRGQLPRRPHDYQAAAPRPAIPGNGVNLSLLITPTWIVRSSGNGVPEEPLERYG